MISHLPHCDFEDAALGGAATPGCAGCRGEAGIAAALDEELAPRSDDHVRIGAAIAAALAAAPIAAPDPTPATTGSAMWPWIVAAVVTAAAVAGVIASRDDDDVVIEQAPVEEPPIEDAGRAVVPAIDDPLPAPQIADTGAIASPEPDASVAKPRRRDRPRAPSSESAAELFARATAARSDGRQREAIALYRRLLDEHGDSREASVASVALGRLLLQTGAAKAALRAFDRYLDRSPNGTLAEEAWIGKAAAAERLGLDQTEATALRELLRRFPDTAARDRARRRLDTLDPGDAAYPTGQ
jgi:TolA-binding protein